MSPAARRTATRRSARKSGGARKTTARKSTGRSASGRSSTARRTTARRKTTARRSTASRRTSGGNATVRGLTTSLDSVDKRLKSARSKVDTSSKRLIRELEGHIKNARKTVQELGKQLQDGASPSRGTARKSTARKSTARKSTARKSTARKTHRRPAQVHCPEEHRCPAHHRSRGQQPARRQHGAAHNGTLGGPRPVCLEQPDGVSLADNGAQAVEIGSH